MRCDCKFKFGDEVSETATDNKGRIELCGVDVLGRHSKNKNKISKKTAGE